MKNRLAFAVMVMFGALALSLHAEEPAEQELKFQAQLGTPSQDGAYAKIFFYSPKDLVKAEIRFASVAEFKPMDKSTKFPEYFSFGTSSLYPAKANEKYLVRGWRTDGSRFTQALTLVSNENSGGVKVTLASYSEESKEKVQAEVAEAARKAEAAKKAQAEMLARGNGDPLFARINAYRVQSGLQPFIWDQSLAVADDAGHTKFRNGQIPGARWTNWAGSTGEGAFNMWYTSNQGHHGHMLSGTHAGIGYWGNTATLNVR